MNSYPFRSAPAAELMQKGFVQQVADMMVYHAPDAHVLLSDEFLDGHCFSIRREENRKGMIGLAFEPMPQRRRMRGMTGVLWLDERTADSTLDNRQFCGWVGRADVFSTTTGGIANHPRRSLVLISSLQNRHSAARPIRKAMALLETGR